MVDIFEQITFDENIKFLKIRKFEIEKDKTEKNINKTVINILKYIDI